MEDINSKDYMERDFNCNTCSKVNSKCIFNSRCRESMIIYKASCKLCGIFYTVNNQNKVKDRIKLHFNETKNLINNGAKIDSFARFIASHFNENLEVENTNGIIGYLSCKKKSIKMWIIRGKN